MPSLLARSIRLRLIAGEGSEPSKTPTVPKASNIVVSIHAIATFQALNDYLRPRLTGLLSTLPGGYKLPGMLFALAAGRIPAELIGAGFPGLAGALTSPSPSLPTPAVASASAPPAPVSQPVRRRSQRLSAKASSASLNENAGATSPWSAGPESTAVS